VGAGAWVLIGPIELDGSTERAWIDKTSSLVEDLADRGAEVVAFQEPSLASSALDGFVLAAVIADGLERRPVGERAVAVGAACELGRGRAASVAIRELTCVDHLVPGRAALVLFGDAPALEQAAAVARGLLGGSPATAGGDLEHVIEASNLPAPPTDLGPRICLYDGASATARTLDGAELRVRRADGLEELGSIGDGELVLLRPRR
jgi:hypothetical protein